jgi:hypothetical protein
MNKDKSLITRKEHALTKNQDTSSLIDKHLDQLSEQKPRDSEEIHEIEFRGGKYKGQIKDGMPHGKGIAEYSEIISGGPRYDFKIRGEWAKGLATGFCVEDFSTVGEKKVEHHDLVERQITIGWFQSDELHGFGARLRDVFDPNYAVGSPNPKPPAFCLAQFDKLSPIGAAAYSIFDWKNEENWLEQESDFVVGNPDDAIEEKRSWLVFRNGVLLEIGHGNSWDRDFDESERDAILNDILVDHDGQRIRWNAPSSASAGGVWVTADVRGHSIDVLKLKSLGLTEGVRSKIISEKVVEISCGEWRPGQKFSGIRFELNSDFDKSRGPWFYRDGKQLAFSLFDDELG